MQNSTRHVFTALAAHIALLNAVPSAAVTFNVAPSVQQTLEAKVQESSAFLKAINVIGVDEASGEALLLGVNGLIASRTNTAAGTKREPLQRQDFTKDSYECKQTNFDSAFPYALLDAWAKFPDFQVRLTNAILERQALDRIMVGFNGTSAAATTNRANNPLGQDVNIGWLQKIRTKAPSQVLDEGEKVAGKVTIGKIKVIKVLGIDTEISGDYQNLDGLVFDAVQMLATEHRANPKLVVMIARNLMHEKLLKAVEAGAGSNVEENAAQEIVSRARVGGLPVVDAPYFPDGTILVTTLDNLSIYYQNGKRRRMLRDEPDYDRIADYQSSNESYVVEDFTSAALVENIVAMTYPAPTPAA